MLLFFCKCRKPTDRQCSNACTQIRAASQPLENEAPWKMMMKKDNDNANSDVITSTSHAKTNRKTEGTDILVITSAEQVI